MNATSKRIFKFRNKLIFNVTQVSIGFAQSCYSQNPDRPQVNPGYIQTKYVCNMLKMKFTCSKINHIQHFMTIETRFFCQVQKGDLKINFVNALAWSQGILWVCFSGRFNFDHIFRGRTQTSHLDFLSFFDSPPPWLTALLHEIC